VRTIRLTPSVLVTQLVWLPQTGDEATQVEEQMKALKK